MVHKVINRIKETHRIILNLEKETDTFVDEWKNAESNEIKEHIFEKVKKNIFLMDDLDKKLKLWSELENNKNSRFESILTKTYKPDDFAIKVESLFPETKEDWECYASTDGFLRIRPILQLSNIGICGKLVLGNPPSEQEVDAWEGSKSADVWDYWSFLGFMMLPFGEWAKRELLIYYERNTFFTQAYVVVKRFEIGTDDEVEKYAQENNLIEEYVSDDAEVILRCEWECLLNDMRKVFIIEPLDGKFWVDGETTYSA
jgi:hypothetical protein